MKAEADKLTRLRRERDTLRETLAVMEEIQALQERLRAIPYVPYVPYVPVAPWNPLSPPWIITATTSGDIDGGIRYVS